eukprot:gene27373-4676_t
MGASSTSKCSRDLGFKKKPYRSNHGRSTLVSTMTILLFMVGSAAGLWL